MAPGLVDAHCHSPHRTWARVGRGEAPPAWRRCFTEAVSARILAADVPAQLGYRGFRQALARLLDAPADEAALVAARDRRAGADPVAHLRLLLDDAAIETLLVDTGFGGPEALDLPDLAALAGRAVHELVRIETVAESLLSTGTPPRRFAAALDERLEAAVAAGAVGFKSIAAYRGGLALAEPSGAAARTALRAHRRGSRLSDPVLVATVVWRAVEIAGRHGLPLQFHTGIGDPDLDLTRADPALLTPLLRDARSATVPIVLLHCYPYLRQAAYLASVYPQVYVDLSLAIPLAAPAAADLVAETLALCPTTKLVAATDGHSYPEMHWWGAVLWRSALRDALARMATIDPPTAEEITVAVLGGTARRLYRLPSPAAHLQS